MSHCRHSAEIVRVEKKRGHAYCCLASWVPAAELSRGMLPSNSVGNFLTRRFLAHSLQNTARLRQYLTWWMKRILVGLPTCSMGGLKDMASVSFPTCIE